MIRKREREIEKNKHLPKVLRFRWNCGRWAAPACVKTYSENVRFKKKIEIYLLITNVYDGSRDRNILRRDVERLQQCQGGEGRKENV